jgi:hypothetical protein
MIIHSVYDPLFGQYGQVLEAGPLAELQAALAQTPVPEGTIYVASDPQLEKLESAKRLCQHGFGFLPVQVGYCNGHNTKLNCLEYHRSSEINFGTGDFILLLAKREEIVSGRLDTKKVKAFLVPAGVPVEIYATSLHYAPCQAQKKAGFQMLVVLPRSTNTAIDLKAFKPLSDEDKRLWADNKWLLAHPESAEAKAGAYVGLTGNNIDIVDDIK